MTITITMVQRHQNVNNKVVIGQIYTHVPIYTYRDNSHLTIKYALSSHHRTFVGIKYFIILYMYSEHSANIVSAAPFLVEHMHSVEIIGHCCKSEAL